MRRATDSFPSALGDWTHGLLIMLALCFTVGNAHGEEPVYPLQPPDRSSPHATLKTFLDSGDALGAFLVREYLPLV